jgi:hypothetical protein
MLRDAPPASFEIRGALQVEHTSDGIRPLRLTPDAMAMLPDDWVRRAATQGSGVRVCFTTDAREIELDVRVLRPVAVSGLDGGEVGVVPPPGVFDLVVDGERRDAAHASEHGLYRLDFRTRAGTAGPAPLTTVAFHGLPGRAAAVEIWLPPHETVTVVALRGDGEVSPPPALGRRWLHHGSSISHGAGAASPTRTWPAVAARESGVELTNLGFAGNALVDPFAARAIRDTPADVISIKLGINVVNHDAMRRRAFVSALEGFLATVRDGHPATPLLVVTPILCPIVERVPGPTVADPAAPGKTPAYRALGRADELADGKLSLAVIRAALADIVARRRAAGDDHLRLVDGRWLYGEADAAARPLPDNLHPDAETHLIMGRRFADVLCATGVIAPASAGGGDG